MADEKNGSGANLGLEKRLWEAADKLRGYMDASDYKHVVFGLVSPKDISDSFEAKRDNLEDFYSNEKSDYYIADEEARYNAIEDRDEYQAENVFWSLPRHAGRQD